MQFQCSNNPRCWVTSQIREQMLVPDILWYEKSILGWFWQLSRTCEKKSLGPIMSNFWGYFFLRFQGQKNQKFFWKYHSVGTVKLHRKKGKKKFSFGIFFFMFLSFFIGYNLSVYIYMKVGNKHLYFYLWHNSFSDQWWIY